MSLRFDAARPAALAPGALEAARAAQRGRRFPAAARDALLAGPGEAAARAREALLAGGVLAVTTGQQPGLFTGPLYTIHKAVTAVALAEALAARWSVPVVPVFWVAGDDHDFAEINHCGVMGADGALATIVLRERGEDAPMLPAYREPVGAEGERALAALEAALPPSEFRAETVAWLRGAYRAERSMAEAHAQALAELLAPLGVVVCRGWDAELKRAGGAVVLEALRAAPALDAALADETERLVAAGGRAQVKVGEGMALAMVEGARGRDRLRMLPEGGFELRRSAERFALADVERMLRTSPERVSANVLLRPVVEAHLLPTVAYVGGPAEVGYLAQVGPLFAHLAVPRPVPVPRLSGFVVEAKVEKVLQRFGLAASQLGALGGADGGLEAALAREALPGDAAEALAALRGALAERYAALQAAAKRVDPTLERPVETARNQGLHAVDEVEKRLVAALKRANQAALDQVGRARANLFPGGEPQERALTVATYLARHGAALLPSIREAAGAHARSLLEAAPAAP